MGETQILGYRPQGSVYQAAGGEGCGGEASAINKKASSGQVCSNSVF